MTKWILRTAETTESNRWVIEERVGPTVKNVHRFFTRKLARDFQHEQKAKVSEAA